jgi:hypothetical protein
MKPYRFRRVCEMNQMRDGGDANALLSPAAFLQNK